MKNLVVAVCGDDSLHRTWIRGQTEFDLFVVYYGKNSKFKGDGKYYATAQGSKFVILTDVLNKHPELFIQYDSIFIPDDDLYMESHEINRFLALFHQYKLAIAQPSIMGYVSWPITAHVLFSSLRYTNLIEIMCPCFSQEALNLCKPTFTENRTNWGIEHLWFRLLGEPSDKIAIVDETIAFHTRPCFFGDTYHNNGTSFEIARDESKAVKDKYKIVDDQSKVFSTIVKDVDEFRCRPSENKLLPESDVMKRFLTAVRSGAL
jgi:hypothetical protein